MHAWALAERLGSAESIFVVGEWLSELLNDEAPPFMRDTPGFARFGKASVSLLERAQQQAIEAAIPQREAPALEDNLARQVVELELGVRTHRLLKDRGIGDIATLAQQSRKRLNWIPGWGPVSTRQVERELFRFGLHLSTEDNEPAIDPNPPPPEG